MNDAFSCEKSARIFNVYGRGNFSRHFHLLLPNTFRDFLSIFVPSLFQIWFNKNFKRKELNNKNTLVSIYVYSATSISIYSFFSDVSSLTLFIFRLSYDKWLIANFIINRALKSERLKERATEIVVRFSITFYSDFSPSLCKELFNLIQTDGICTCCVMSCFFSHFGSIFVWRQLKSTVKSFCTWKYDYIISITQFKCTFVLYNKNPITITIYYLHWEFVLNGLLENVSIQFGFGENKQIKM